MGTKHDNGCHRRALDDEPIFTLLARDKAAPDAIMAWIEARQRHGYDDPEDLARQAQAEEIAADMQSWRRHNEGDDMTLATWRRGSVFSDPQPDNFSSESPLRAFTEWQAGSHFAIGKGLRPSFAHIANYLSAIERQEGWRLVQVLYADQPQRMSMVFRRLGAYIDDPRNENLMASAFAEKTEGTQPERKIGKHPNLAAPYGDDPINPKHYDGRACADIGERLSGNGYQILKYCWRLGKKDDPCQELGKAIWYAESERSLNSMKSFPNFTSPNKRGLKHEEAWFEERIADQPQFTQNIARMLWAGYDARGLTAIIEAISEHRFHLDCGRGLAV